MCILFLLASGACRAAITGRIGGTVTDAKTDKPLTGVNIYIEGTPLGATSDLSGRYVIEQVPVGLHKVTFKMIGYKVRTFINIMVRQNETTSLDAALTEQPIELQGLQIVADRFFSEPSDAPVSAATLDIGEIRTQPSGSYDIQRAIQVLPSVVSGADGLNEIIIRGGNFGENLFIIDHIEIDNPNHFAYPSSGGGPVSMITPELVRELTFFGGAFPSRYGDKTSSVLDVNTREANDRFEAKVDIGMAGFGGNIGGPLFSGKGNALFLYHRSFLSLLKSSIGLSAVPNYQSAIGRETFHLSETQTLTLNQFWGNDWIDISHDDLSAYTSSARFEDIYNKSGQYTLGATLKSIYRSSYSILTVSRNERWWENDIYDANTRSEATRVSQYHSKESRNTLRYTHEFLKTPAGDIEAGIFFKYDHISADIFRRPDSVYVWDTAAGNPDSLFTIYTISPNNRIEPEFSAVKAGGFLECEKQVWWLTLNAGIRYDYFSYTGEGTVAPTFGLKMPLPIMANLRMGLGRYYQTPDYFTLSFDEKNRDLKSKYTDQAVVGIDFLPAEDMRVRVELFYKKYNRVAVNAAYTTPDPYDFAVHSLSVGSGTAKGVEVLFQKKVNHNWWSTVSYSYSNAVAFDPRYPGENREYAWDFDYTHIFTAVLGYKIEFLTFGWYARNRSWLQWLGFFLPVLSDESELSIRFRTMGGSPYTELSLLPQYNRYFLLEDQPFNADRIPAYRRLDVHLHHHWFLKGWTVIAYFELNNVFNTDNVWKYNFVNAENQPGGESLRETTYQWGRTFVGGLMVEL